MKLTFFLFQLGAVMGGLVERNKPGCDSDNCARAVTGTRRGPASVTAHQADCLSFQQLTTYFGLNSVASPTATPTYASECNDPGDSYASACSCWGFPVVTTTVYPPVYDDAGTDDVAH